MPSATRSGAIFADFSAHVHQNMF